MYLQTNNSYHHSAFVKTTNVGKVKLWAIQRGGKPAVIKDTDILQIKLPKTGDNENELKTIDWKSFEELFIKHHCIFLHENDDRSSFHKVIENIDN